MLLVSWMEKPRRPDPEATGDGDPVAGYRVLAASGFALAVQLLGHREDAADVVQDAFRVVVSKRRLFDPGRGQPKAWFLKIVRNRCLDLLRKRRRPISSLEPGQVAADGRQRPDLVAQRSEMLELLKRQLMAMPQKQREIVLLRDYHQLSYAEIARVLSIPAGTVMSRLHRARAELRRRMERFDH